MTRAVTLPPNSPKAAGSDPARPAPISIDEWNRMIEVGALADRRCELIDGEIVDMPASGNAHAIATQRLYDALRRHFPDPWFIKCQSTQRAGERYAPDPDLTLVTQLPTIGARLDEPPSLVVEISDSTLTKDLTRKKLAYARHAMREYWVVNLHRRIIHVFRDPNVNATLHAESYASERQVGLDGVVAPLVDETKTIRVADFMPTAGAEPDESA